MSSHTASASVVDRNDLAEILAARRADPYLPAWPDEKPTLAELHADDVISGAIRINEQRVMGAYSILRPDPEAVGRWLFVCAKPTRELAEAWCEGYCARRDEAL